MRAKTEIFEVVINNEPVTVKATPFTMHTNEKRYRVSIDDSPVYIYAWQDDMDRYTLLQSSRAATQLPEFVDEEIGRTLYSRMAA
jgi:hypothetical protein